MKNILLTFVALFCFAQIATAQIYLDEFDNGDVTALSGDGSYSYAEADGELTISVDGTGGAYSAFSYSLHNVDDNSAVIVDATENNKIYVRAKASIIGTELRMDLADAAGFVTTQNAQAKILTTEYTIFEFDYTGAYVDGGYGGTSCMTGPCDVDGTMAASLTFFTNAVSGGFAGSIVIDYISFGVEPDGEIVSDVFQDHMDNDSSLTSFVDQGIGYTFEQSESMITITGDGSTGAWDAFAYEFRTPPTYENTDVDVTGTDKLYIKMRSSVAGTSVRCDLQDLDGFITTAGSITKIVDEEWTVFEFNFAGSYNDLGYGGTPCTESTAPCPVDGTRIASMVFFIEPGTGQYVGSLDIDYFSVGNSLEPAGPEAALVYNDHFDNETIEFVEDPGGFSSTETGTEWTLTGDGSAGAFAAASYSFHDKVTGEGISLDLTPAQDKVFIKAKTNGGTVPLRVDLVDIDGFVSTQPSLTRVVEEEYSVFEFDFSGGYVDAGYGGTACETGPCPLDATQITTVLLYPNPAEGMYAGEVIIDYISVGQELDDSSGPLGVLNYQDQTDGAEPFVANPDGYSSTFSGGEWTITGDGTGGEYALIDYDMYSVAGTPIIANAMGSGNVLYMRAKSSVDQTVLRADLTDNMGFTTSLAGLSNTLTTDYAVYEYNFDGNYTDGGYGGTACETGPCPVDGERIAKMGLFVNPGVAAFAGDVTIDWFAFQDLTTNVDDVEALDALHVYPNPATTELGISFDLTEKSDVSLRLYDVTGRLVATQNLDNQASGNNFARMSVSELTNGIYFLQVNVNGQNANAISIIKE